MESNLCSQGNQTELLSCELISLIDQNYIEIIFFENQKFARDSAYKGNIDGIMILAKYMTDIMNSVGSQEQLHQIERLKPFPPPHKY